MWTRHSLVWLTDAGWARVLDTLAPDDAAAAEDWRRNGWPAIVRRNEDGADTESVPLGLPLLPLDEAPANGVALAGKRRLGFFARKSHVARMQLPLALRDAVDVAPAEWKAALHALDVSITQSGMTTRVYGSLALSRLTGRNYLRPGSDIDLLVQPSSLAQLDAAANLLERFAERLPLDGELVFPSGQAVAWKEWLQARKDGAGASRVLVKRQDGIALVRLDSLLAGYPSIQNTISKDVPCWANL